MGAVPLLCDLYYSPRHVQMSAFILRRLIVQTVIVMVSVAFIAFFCSRYDGRSGGLPLLGRMPPEQNPGRAADGRAGTDFGQVLALSDQCRSGR